MWIMVLSGAVVVVATIVGLWAFDRWYDRSTKAGGDGPDEGERELRRRLRATGIDVSPEVIACWSNREYDQAWEYVRQIEGPADLVIPVPKFLRQRWSVPHD